MQLGFCSLAYLASREKQCIFRGVAFDPDRDLEPDFVGEEEEEFERQDKDAEDIASLQAVVHPIPLFEPPGPLASNKG